MQWGLVAGGLLLIVLTIILAGRTHDHRMITLLAHNLPWAFTLMIAGSGLIHYSKLHPSAIATILAGVGSFNLGLFLSLRFDRRVRKEFSAVRSPVISLRLYLGLWIGFVAGVGLLLWTIQRLVGLSLLLTNPSAVRGFGGGQYLADFPLWGKFLFYLGPFIVALTANPGTVAGLERVRFPVRLALIGAALVLEAVALQRTNIVASVSLAVAMYAYRGNLTKAMAKKIVSAGGVAGLIALLAFAGIGTALRKTVTATPSSLQYYAPAIRDTQLSEVMYYASSGIVAFGILTQSDNRTWPPYDSRRAVGDYNPQTWGAASFPALLKVVPVTRGWPEVEPSVLVPMRTNVYTWLSPWYRDFRLPGVLLIPLLIALVAGAASVRVVGSDGWSMIAGVIATALLLAPFANRFLSTMTLELLAIGLVMVWVERRNVRRNAARAAEADVVSE